MEPTENDLLVVGTGRLGILVARQWRIDYPTARIECVTQTTKRHEQLRSEGYIPTTTETQETTQYPYVLFSAPPGDDYAQCVATTRQRVKTGGRFVFTSATSVYNDSGIVTETSQLSDTPRARRLLDAEQEVGEEGVIVRLGMLFTIDTGAHSWWLKKGSVTGAETCVYNSIHYEDAARLCVTALRSTLTGAKLIGTDGVPLTAFEICSAARKHKLFSHFDMPTFGSGGPEKRVDNSWSRNALNWSPKWKSYATFLESDGDKTS